MAEIESILRAKDTKSAGVDGHAATRVHAKHAASDNGARRGDTATGNPSSASTERSFRRPRRVIDMWEAKSKLKRKEDPGPRKYV
ncbi:MAG: hypothetical protein H5U02_11405 [Clostridia bacterium]|nr:hypothetical protein [Clostridia bacterium]